MTGRLLLISSAFIVIKCREESTITRQLKELFDILDYINVPDCYYKKFNSTTFPTRIFVDFFEDDNQQRQIRVVLDGDYTIYQGPVRSNSIFETDGTLKCPDCHRIIGNSHLNLFKSSQSRILFHIKNNQTEANYFLTDVLSQVGQAIEIFNQLVVNNSWYTFLPDQPIRDVIITKNLVTDLPPVRTFETSKVTIDNQVCYDGIQMCTFFDLNCEQICKYC